jgi:murein DD-endopeptidase MepM/ murein hydrolase activator NlpD
VAGARASSPFGIRADPFTGKPAAHAGLDLSGPGGTAIEASAAGVVVDAGPRGGYGLAVEIDHGSGITTFYGHASQVLVQPGQRVERGEPVALLGDTGRSTGPHLHFEVRSNGSPVDPRRALNAYGSRADNMDGSLPLASLRSP